jgi:hypothetical protein
LERGAWRNDQFAGLLARASEPRARIQVFVITAPSAAAETANAAPSRIVAICFIVRLPAFLSMEPF